MNPLDQYRTDVSDLMRAGIGIILTRTREPLRVSQELEKLATDKGVPFRQWSLAYGWEWEEDNDKNEAVVKADGILKPDVALMRIGGIKPPRPDSGGEVITANEPFPKGIYVMHNVGQFLTKSPLMVQILLRYVSDFAANGTRLILVDGEGSELPTCLRDDVSVMDFSTPNYNELRELLIDSVVMEDLENELDTNVPFTDDQIRALSSAGGGMTSSQFDAGVSKAYMKNKSILEDGTTDKLFKAMLDDLIETKVEVVKRSKCLSVIPATSLNDIGGLDLLKSWIMERKDCFSEEARAFGIDAPKGVFLAGMAGTGKSASAQAIAGTLCLPLINFDISAVFNSLVGSSEAEVRSALAMVEALAPCVVLLDEVDKAGFSTSAGSGDSGVGKRILGKILNSMQSSKSGVFWVMTANRVEGLPPELLRKGRLDELFAVDLPNLVEREEVAKIHIAKRGHDPESVGDLSVFSANSAGYVSSEIEAAVKNGLIRAFHAGGRLHVDHILESIKESPPMSEAFKEECDRMLEWGRAHARPTSSVIEADDVTPKAVAPRRRMRRELQED